MNFLTTGRLLFAAVIALLLAIYTQKGHDNQKLLQQSAFKAMDSIAFSWEQQIKGIIHQADPLLELTRETLNNKAILEQHRWILENAFKSHLKYNLDKLFQIRLLSHDGIELLRAEASGGNKVVIMPIDKLQDKSQYEYFIVASSGSYSKSGEYYLSEVELNRDNGFVDDRLILTQRFITPIKDAISDRNYYLVLNAYAKPFIELLDAASGVFADYLMVSTESGYLVHKSAINSGVSEVSTIAECCQDIWHEITSHPFHQEPQIVTAQSNPNDLFVHLPIADARLSKRLITPNKLVPKNHFWHLLLYIPEEKKDDVLNDIYLTKSRKELNPAGKL